MADVCAAGQWVIISTNGEKRLLKVEAANKVVIDHARISASELVGLPFGAVLKSAGTKVCVDERIAEDINGVANEWARVVEAEEEQRTNKALFDDGNAQSLSSAQIEQLKAQGLEGAEVIKKIAESSVTFEGKTTFSQHKYLKKKAKKYTPVVQLLRCTPTELCEVYALTQKLDKIHELRADALALLLARANVRSGARVLVLDTSTGLVAGAVAQRMGGRGTLLVVHAKPHVPLDGLHHLNLRDDEWATVAAAPLDDVRNALELPASASAGAPAAAGASDDAATGDPALPSVARSNGRTYRTLAPAESARWLADGFDAIVVCMHASSPELLRTLVRAARPSGAIVVYNACSHPLAQFAHECAPMSAPVLSPQLCETWAREYQVLPNRTHPVMTNMIPSGYVFSGYARPQGDPAAASRA
jgi:tRNA (adenine-N(1)-)-methyltransferase non-catalytic subunit